MPDLQDPTVSVQGDPASVASSGSAGNGEAAQSQNGENQGVQSSGEANAQGQLESTQLPPELEETRKHLLRDYHSKTQKLADDKMRFEREMSNLNERSQTLETLLQQDWFRQAAEAERARRNGTPQFDMTDDQFELIKTDKNAFKQAVLSMAAEMVKSKVDPAVGAIGKTQEEVQSIQAEQELNNLAGKYKDFDEVNNKGGLDPYLEAGYDYETAYQKFKWDEGGGIDGLAEKKAQEVLKNSRDGAVGVRGTPSVNGNLVVKARNLDEALDRVLDAMSRGHKDVQVERTK